MIVFPGSGVAASRLDSRGRLSPQEIFLYTADSELFFSMVPLRAILHAHNDALRIGRCLETLYPCDEIVIVDHGSQDGTVQVAREYGARIVQAGAEGGAIGDLWGGGVGREEWILCLDPSESLTESLAASLFEWKSEAAAENDSVYSVFLREETAEGWVENPIAQTRLVPAGWQKWAGRFPQNEDSALVLEGELLRFVLP
jgi:cellulose synthase/poly-beta-1,6-N-acetylglucosamine synthase-like glycosyltransferase